MSNLLVISNPFFIILWKLKVLHYGYWLSWASHLQWHLIPHCSKHMKTLEPENYSFRHHFLSQFSNISLCPPASRSSIILEPFPACLIFYFIPHPNFYHFYHLNILAIFLFLKFIETKHTWTQTWMSWLSYFRDCVIAEKNPQSIISQIDVTINLCVQQVTEYAIPDYSFYHCHEYLREVI